MADFFTMSNQGSGNDGLEAYPVRSLTEVLADVQRDLSVVNRRNSNNVQYLTRLNEVATFVKGVYAGKIPTSRFQEAMSTSDFPLLFGDVLDRQLLGGYEATPSVWSKFFKRGTVRDFRVNRRITLDGMETPFDMKKPDGSGIPVQDNDLVEGQYNTSVDVYEKGYNLSWRAIINDDLEGLRTMPARLARGARRTEDRLATRLYCGASGPNATFFSNGNKNLINTANGAASNNPAFSVQGVRDAYTVYSRQVDAGGDPIFIGGAVLVIPPALEITAMEILKATQLEINPGVVSGTGLMTQNWIASKISVVVDYYAPIVNTTNGHTAWYLFAAPNDGRGAGEMTFLRGYETPTLYQKAPNTQRVGGGIDPALGDFEDMGQRFKCLHIVGGTLLDPKNAVCSDGTGI